MTDLSALIPVQQELSIQMPAVAVMEVMWWTLAKRLPMDCGPKLKLHLEGVESSLFRVAIICREIGRPQSEVAY